MNYSTAVFLINDKVRAIKVSYDKAVEGSLLKTITFKSLNSKIKVEDYVVIPTSTRHGMTVCQVEEVDVEPNFEQVPEMEWLVGVVDREDFEKTNKLEKEAITAIKGAEFKRRRRELRKDMLEDDEDAVKGLGIYSGK